MKKWLLIHLIFFLFYNIVIRTTPHDDLVSTEAQNKDLKNQLKVAEQEINILRTKINNLEQENDKLLAEIKKNQIHTSKNFIKGPNSATNCKENEALKITLEELKNQNEQLIKKFKLLESGTTKLSERTPKTYSDLSTKFQLKVCYTQQ